MNVLDHSTKDSAKDYLGKVCFFSNNVSSFTNPVSKCQLGVLDGFTRGDHCFRSGNPNSVWKFCLPVTNNLADDPDFHYPDNGY